MSQKSTQSFSNGSMPGRRDSRYPGDIESTSYRRPDSWPSDKVADDGPNMAHARTVLDRYQERANIVKEEFLNQLTRHALSYEAEQEQKRLAQARHDAVTNSMIDIVNAVYCTIEPYISEFNKAVRSTQLFVSCTPPALVTEHLTYNRLRQPVDSVTTYRARISTPRLSVVVRGFENTVDFFLLSSATVMGLTRVEQEHAPLMTFVGSLNGWDVEWQVENKPLSNERLERYSLLVFEHLIDETRQDLAQSQAS